MPAIPDWVGAEKLINSCQGVGHGLPVGRISHAAARSESTSEPQSTANGFIRVPRHARVDDA